MGFHVTAAADDIIMEMVRMPWKHNRGELLTPIGGFNL
jgi:hypothetical protein